MPESASTWSCFPEAGLARALLHGAQCFGGRLQAACVAFSTTVFCSAVEMRKKYEDWQELLALQSRFTYMV